MTIQPLNDRVPITNPDGTPTQYFLRQLQERGISVDDKITEAEAIALINEALGDHSVNAGTGLSGGGPLNTDPTLALDATLGQLNDVDLSTPPTDGQVIVYDAGSSTWLPADQSGGGGGSSGFKLLSSTTLVLTAANISFGSIPSGYRDLILTGETRQSSGGDVDVLAQLNGDTTAGNYSWYVENRFGNGTGNGGIRVGSSISSSATASTYGTWESVINNYLSSTPKTYLELSAFFPGSNFVDTGGGSWTGTAPITSMLVFPSSGSFAAGSTVSLYGRGT